MTMIHESMAKAIQQQIGHEYFNSLQYTVVATYFDQEGLKKLAALYYKQSAEEREHAEKFLRFLVDTGSSIDLPGLPAPQCGFTSAEEAVQSAVNLEWDTTRRIHKLMDLAVEQKDYLTQDMLRWFVTEQMEEISTQENLLRMVQMSGQKSLLMVEAYLSHQ